jgi:hypothetical protein
MSQRSGWKRGSATPRPRGETDGAEADVVEEVAGADALGYQLDQVARLG